MDSKISKTDRFLRDSGLRERRNAHHGEKKDAAGVDETPQEKDERSKKTIGKTPDGSSE